MHFSCAHMLVSDSLATFTSSRALVVVARIKLKKNTCGPPPGARRTDNWRVQMAGRVKRESRWDDERAGESRTSAQPGNRHAARPPHGARASSFASVPVSAAGVGCVATGGPVAGAASLIHPPDGRRPSNALLPSLAPVVVAPPKFCDPDAPRRPRRHL